MTETDGFKEDDGQNAYLPTQEEIARMKQELRQKKGRQKHSTKIDGLPPPRIKRGNRYRYIPLE